MGGESPISWTAIDRYAARYGIEGQDFEILHRMITALDDVWLEHVAAKAKAEAEKQGRP